MTTDDEHDKKIIFYDSNRRHVDLKIRLKYDEITQSEFFRCLITGYLDKDEGIISYLDSYAQRKKKRSKLKTKAANDLLEDGNQIKNVFALDENEIENIFDILEQEHPELQALLYRAHYLPL